MAAVKRWAAEVSVGWEVLDMSVSGLPVYDWVLDPPL